MALCNWRSLQRGNMANQIQLVSSDRAEEVIKTLTAAARTGKIGDGKLFIYEVAEAIRIRNDDRGDAAL
jgi:nitrogen regulatory protein P-II 1